MNFLGGVPNTGDPTQVTPTVDGYKNAAAWGHGTFPVYWMLNFFGESFPGICSERLLIRVIVGMIALGLACENVAMIVGQPWYAQVLTMVNSTQLTLKQDRSLADLLGNHQRVDCLLRH